MWEAEFHNFVLKIVLDYSRKKITMIIVIIPQLEKSKGNKIMKTKKKRTVKKKFKQITVS